MSTLDPEQYEAIGRLTLSFNHLEVAFELYTAYLPNAPEWKTGAAVAGEGMFRQKADRFARVLTVIAEYHPSLSPVVETLNALITQAKRLADERNKYVHAIVVHDTLTNTPCLKKGKDD